MGGLSEARLAGAIALAIALTNVPCMAHAQDSNPDPAAPNAQSTQQADATRTPAKPNTDGGAGTPGNASDLGAVTVTGIRASLMSAQSLKQNADQIIDSVTATDINALPDRSVTETLQRISGVTVDHFLADDDPNHPAAEGSGSPIRSSTRSPSRGGCSRAACRGRRSPSSPTSSGRRSTRAIARCRTLRRRRRCCSC
jgi:hypothetical protein